METNNTDRAAARLAADICRDVAADNEHNCAIEGLIPQCRYCDGSGVDGDEDCGCQNGRERCECGEPALRYEHFQALVHGTGGAVVMGTVREPRCLRCCQQTVGLVGPLTGWENDPNDEPGAPFDPMCIVAGGYESAAGVT